MTPAETLKYNQLIADFMEVDFNHHAFSILDTDCEFPHYRQGTIKDAKYDWSWDWLMPVVKKIAKLILNKDWEDLQEAVKRWKPITNELQKVESDGVYFCVVKFIEWYNGATDGRAAIA